VSQRCYQAIHAANVANGHDILHRIHVLVSIMDIMSAHEYLFILANACCFLICLGYNMLVVIIFTLASRNNTLTYTHTNVRTKRGRKKGMCKTYF
jgi:hypothetical protein